MQVGAYLFGTEFAADKGVDVLDQLRVELIGFSPALFGQPALPLGFFGTVLPPLGAVPLDFAADGAFVAVKLFGGFGDGAVAGRVFGYGIVRLGAVACSPWQSFLQERPYATAYRPFSVMESCTSNANPLRPECYKSSEKRLAARASYKQKFGYYLRQNVKIGQLGQVSG